MKFTDYLKLDNVLLVERDDPGVKLHLTHLEDLAIEQGKAGFANFEDQVTNLLNFLMGLTSNAQLHLKVDGSPAIFFGPDPRPSYKNQFFVATKSAFNVNNPKILHSNEEIEATYSGPLAQKLKDALAELSKAYDNSGLIYQGDLLFSNPSEKKVQDADGSRFITFKPNVLVYAVPVDGQSELYHRVNAAKLGIILHDSFKGQSISNGAAIRVVHAGKDFESIKGAGEMHNVFIEDSAYKSVSLQVSSVTRVKIRELLAQSRTFIQEIGDDFDKTWKDSTSLPLLKNYLNEQVRVNGNFFKGALKGKSFDNKGFKTGFSAWIKKKYDLESATRKTDKGQVAVLARRDGILNWLNENDYDFNRLLHATYNMLQIKNEFLKLVSEVGSKLGKTFYQLPDGTLQVAAGEGFVSFIGTNQVKLVDRLDFSAKNFQKNLSPTTETFEVPGLTESYGPGKVKRVGYFAGGFKPPHLGHFNVAKQASKENDEVHIIIGPKQRPPISADEAAAIWRVFARSLPNVIIDPIAEITPVRTAYETVEKLNNSKDAHKYELTFYADHDDMPQYKNMEKYSGNLIGVNLVETIRTMSATKVREFILAQDWGKVAACMPVGVDVPQVIRLLKLALNS